MRFGDYLEQLKPKPKWKRKKKKGDGGVWHSLIKRRDGAVDTGDARDQVGARTGEQVPTGTGWWWK